MPMLTNIARADATFDQTELYDTSTVTVEIPAIKLDKVSDALNGVWIGDELTYTITITNMDTAIEATELSFTDTIDPALAKLVLTSVMVGTTQLVEDEHFDYDPQTGKLDIPGQTAYTMPTIAAGGSYDVTFRVTKV